MGHSRLLALRHWIPAIVAVLVIAFESTALMSANNTSRWLLPIWEHLFGPISPKDWSVVHHYIRKSGHFTGYGLVSLCFFHGFRTTLSAARGLRVLWLRSAVFALGCTFLVASADEIHQAFLPHRGSSPYDVLLDTCGALLMQLIILALMPRINRTSPPPLAESFAK
ncbi:MAG: VanZ family protein [Acidobacteriaceae bacterium]